MQNDKLTGKLYASAKGLALGIEFQELKSTVRL